MAGSNNHDHQKFGKTCQQVINFSYMIALKLQIQKWGYDNITIINDKIIEGNNVQTDDERVRIFTQYNM